MLKKVKKHLPYQTKRKLCFKPKKNFFKTDFTMKCTFKLFQSKTNVIRKKGLLKLNLKTG